MIYVGVSACLFAQFLIKKEQASLYIKFLSFCLNHQ